MTQSGPSRWNTTDATVFMHANNTRRIFLSIAIRVKNTRVQLTMYLYFDCRSFNRFPMETERMFLSLLMTSQNKKKVPIDDAVRTQVVRVSCNLEYFRPSVSGRRVEIIKIQRSRFKIIQTTRSIA